MGKENKDLKIKVSTTSAFTWDCNAAPGPGITDDNQSGVCIPDVPGLRGLAMWRQYQPKLKSKPDH